MPRSAKTSTRSDYVPEFGGVVEIREIDRPNASDDIETAQTILFMDQLAADEANHPAIESATRDALADAGLNLTSDAIEQAHAIYWWLKRTIRYVPTPGTSPFVDQTLISPCAMLAMPEPIGDCPQFSMLAAAMFHVLCIPCSFVTIAADERDPGQWSHVYNLVEVRPNLFLPFDSSNGPEPGAEYSEPFRRRVWKRRHGPCRTKETSPDMIRAMKRNPAVGMRNAVLRGGLGDITCDADSNCYDTSSGTLVYSPSDPSFNPGGLPDVVPPGTYSGGYDPFPTPTGGGSNWSSLFSQIIGAGEQVGLSLLRSQTSKPVYVPGPGGAGGVLYNPATGQYTPAPSTPINSNLLLFGALGIGALVLLGGKK